MVKEQCLALLLTAGSSIAVIFVIAMNRDMICFDHIIKIAATYTSDTLFTVSLLFM